MNKEKILTISIAAYNVGRYIDQTLESIIIEEFLDEIEVFIVDDGSTDDIEMHVDKYTKMYPNTFHYVKKENGGYGSTVNWSVKHARGKFFKLLDGDDYLEKDGLKKLIEILHVTRADAIVSQAARVYEDGRRNTIFELPDKSSERDVYNIGEVVKYADIAVWGYTIRTDIVRKNWNDLPKNHFYTDRIFVLQALLGVETIQYHGDTVYLYRVGYDEQSTSVKSIRNHYNEALNVDRMCMEFYVNNLNKDYDSLGYIEKRLSLNCAYTFCMLLELDINLRNFNILKEYDRQVRLCSESIYQNEHMFVKRVRLIRFMNYMGYWLWPVLRHLRKN